MNQIKRWRYSAIFMAFVTGFFGMELIRDFLTCFTPFLPCMFKAGVDTAFTVVGVVFTYKIHVKYKEATANLGDV